MKGKNIDHIKRNRIVTTDKMFKTISSDFMLLYTESRAARYDPKYKTTQKKITSLIRNEMENIETQLSALL